MPDIAIPDQPHGPPMDAEAAAIGERGEDVPDIRDWRWDAHAGMASC